MWEKLPRMLDLSMSLQMLDLIQILRISNLSMKLQRNLTFFIIFTTFIGKIIVAEMESKFVCPSGFHSHGSDKCLRQDFILFVGTGS